MLSSLFNLAAAYANGAAQARAYARRLELEMRERRLTLEARQRIVGRMFKCGTHRWTIVPKHMGVSGLALTPEIKAVKMYVDTKYKTT